MDWEKPFIGLENDSAEMNCFLNSALQALQHMSNLIFTSEGFKCQSLSKLHSCIACSLLKFFKDYSVELRSTKLSIHAVELRMELARISNNAQFSINEMADSMEVLYAILSGVHNSFNGIYDSIHLHEVEQCDCPVHSELVLRFEESFSCSCGNTKTIKVSSLLIPYSTSQYQGDLAALYKTQDHDIPYTFIHLEMFAQYLEQQGSKVVNTICDCGLTVQATKRLMNAPSYLIFQVVWENRFQPLKTLELIISLKLTFKLKEIFNCEYNDTYNLTGVIVNSPGHYFYIGRVDNFWWHVNDEKVIKIGALCYLLEFFGNKNYRVVGMIYEKSDYQYTPDVDLGFLRSAENDIKRSSTCKSCDSFKLNMKCDSCEFKEPNFSKAWICEDCEYLNIGLSLSCCICHKRRYKAKNNKCNKCSNITTHLTCKNHTISYCHSCAEGIYSYDDSFCSECLKIANILSCNCANQEKGIICRKCLNKYWICQKCDRRVFNSSVCNICGFNQDDRIWYCFECKTTNPIELPCEKCERSKRKNRYCTVCGENRVKDQCKCPSIYSCGFCMEKNSCSEKMACWKCGEILIDYYCSKCNCFIPREWTGCASCIIKLGEHATRLNTGKELKARNSMANLCISCGCYTEESYYFCWRCGVNNNYLNCRDCSEKKNICRDCLKVSFRCVQCKYTLTSDTCICGKASINDIVETSIINSIKNADDWECRKCNYFNKQNVLFCERCNHYKEYSFSKFFICKYCNEKSHQELCKRCYWLNHCSFCEKKMYVSQSVMCGDCGSTCKGYFCTKCKISLTKHRILCRVCALFMKRCNCGKKMHPKSNACANCIEKLQFLEKQCVNCNSTVILDACPYCAYSLENNKCNNCLSITESTKNYYCRLCVLMLKKCRICKARQIGKCLCDIAKQNSGYKKILDKHESIIQSLSSYLAKS